MATLLALVLAVTAGAPYRLVDSVGEPVRGATVQVTGPVSSSAVAVTDSEGRFRLDPEPAPPFEVTVIGARGAVLGRARVESAASRLLVLHPIETELVTVRGSPLPATSAVRSSRVSARSHPTGSTSSPAFAGTSSRPRTAAGSSETTTRRGARFRGFSG